MAIHRRLSNVDEARVIKVIEIKSVVGDGTTADPCRLITEYFSLAGERLARVKEFEGVENIHEWEE